MQLGGKGMGGGSQKTNNKGWGGLGQFPDLRRGLPKKREWCF